MENSTAFSLVVCLVLIAVTVILLRRSYRYFGRHARDEGPIARVTAAGGLPPGGARDPAAQWMREEVRMHETARALAAKLDSKISVLEYLTGTAQQQIDRLEALIKKAQQVAGGDAGTNDTENGTRLDR